MVPAGARGFGLLRLQEFFRLGFETFAAAAGAEEIILALIGGAMLGGRGIDAHAADRIDRDRRVGYLSASPCWPPQQGETCAAP